MSAMFDYRQRAAAGSRRVISRRVSRRLLRHEIRRALLDSLLSGQLSAGEQVTEVQLAKDLGVSRTPLREALFGLEQDGFFLPREGKSLVVSPLTPDEVRHIYSILALLEGLAVRSMPPLPLELEPDAPLSRCANMELVKLIDRFRDRAARYEHAYTRARGFPPYDEASWQILTAFLREGNVDEAADRIERFRLETSSVLTDWLA